MKQRDSKPLSRIFKPWGFLEKFSEHPRYGLFRDAVLAFVVALFGVAAGLIIVEPWVTKAPAVSTIRIGNQEVPTGKPRPMPVLAEARKRFRSTVTLRGPGLEHKTTWAELGADINLESVDRLLVELGREDSPAARYYRDKGDENTIPNMPLPISLGSTTAVESLMVLKEIIDRKPQNAKFDFTSDKVIDEQPGRSLDIYSTLEKLDQALVNGQNKIDMVVSEINPPITAKDLSKIDVSEVLGFFKTRHSRMSKDRNRTFNLKLGSSMLDGQVILPGQTFGFNDTLGDRSEARGFRYAPVIAAGTIVEGMGGGTCQVASTLYAASFFAGLRIVERQPHSRPSSYIKLGLDATVSYPALDLKMTNPFDFPVVIHYKMKDGWLYAEIRGKKRHYTTTLLRKIVGTRPFPVRTIEDSKLPKGTEVITQKGIPGYTVQRYQIIERDKVGYRFGTVDKYPPTVQFVHKGVGSISEPASDAPKEDKHKPYRASSSLRMVQGPDIWYEQSHE